jgi:hypothetical protein
MICMWDDSIFLFCVVCHSQHRYCSRLCMSILVAEVCLRYTGVASTTPRGRLILWDGRIHPSRFCQHLTGKGMISVAGVCLRYTEVACTTPWGRLIQWDDRMHPFKSCWHLTGKGMILVYGMRWYHYIMLQTTGVSLRGRKCRIVFYVHSTCGKLVRWLAETCACRP